MLDKAAVLHRIASEIDKQLRDRPQPLAFEGVIDARVRLEELGIGSLDLAELISNLEAVFGTDPFAELVPITSIVTVGDLADAYLLALDADPDTGPDSELLAVRLAAQGRA